MPASLACMPRTRPCIARCGQLGLFCKSSFGSWSVLHQLGCYSGYTRPVFHLLPCMVRGFGAHTGSRPPLVSVVLRWCVPTCRCSGRLLAFAPLYPRIFYCVSLTLDPLTVSGGCVRCAFGMALLLSPRNTYISALPLMLAGPLLHWLWRIGHGQCSEGFGAWVMTWWSVPPTWFTWTFNVSANCSMPKLLLFGQILITALEHAHPTRLVCVHIKLGVLGLLHVVGSLMFISHCLLHVSDRYSSFDWFVMVCLATLAHGQVSLVLTGCADFAVLAPWVMRSILFLSVPICNPFGTNIRDCLGFQPRCSSSGRMILWMYPSSFVNVWMWCWVLTLTIRVRHLISPRWLEKM